MQGHSEPNRELLDAAALCRQLVPEGSVEAFLADHRQELFPDEMFADLFPSGRGRPSVPADVIATVIGLQSLEGLADRDAARALADRISWKVAAAWPWITRGSTTRSSPTGERGFGPRSIRSGSSMRCVPSSTPPVC